MGFHDPGHAARCTYKATAFRQCCLSANHHAHTHTAHMVKNSECKPRSTSSFTESALPDVVCLCMLQSRNKKKRRTAKEETLTSTCSLLSSVKAFTSCIRSLSSRRTTLTASLKRQKEKKDFTCSATKPSADRPHTQKLQKSWQRTGVSEP